MALNLNKVIIAGRLTSDVELKMTPAGIPVASFAVAVNSIKKNTETTTQFFNCQAWRERAEFVSKYFGRGTAICVIGHLQISSYTDKNGAKRTNIEIIADEVNFVEGRKSQDEQGETVSTVETANYTPNTPNTPNVQFTEVGDEEDLPF